MRLAIPSRCAKPFPVIFNNPASDRLARDDMKARPLIQIAEHNKNIEVSWRVKTLTFITQNPRLLATLGRLTLDGNRP